MSKKRVYNMGDREYERRNKNYRSWIRKQDKTILKGKVYEALSASLNIPNFMYTGELELGRTWTFTFSTHRDADILNISNYEVILEDLQRVNKDHVEVAECGHWGVGWIKHITVKMIHDGRITAVAKRVMWWKDRLEDYPVADEDDYSEREMQKQEENFEYYKGEFCEEVLKYVGRNKNSTYRKKELEILAYYIYVNDCGYRGIEDAYVTPDSIDRFSYSDYSIEENNYWLKELNVMRKAKGIAS